MAATPVGMNRFYAILAGVADLAAVAVAIVGGGDQVAGAGFGRPNRKP